MRATPKIVSPSDICLWLFLFLIFVIDARSRRNMYDSPHLESQYRVYESRFFQKTRQKMFARRGFINFANQ